MTALPFVYDDGGRAAAGYLGDAGDCVTRAVAIVGMHSYRHVYDELAAGEARRGKPRSARDGVSPKVYRPWLDDNGWRWTPLMQIGSGCTVHLAEGELPDEPRLLVRLSGHLAAVVDGVVRDTHDPGRDGTRCVYGYWTPPPLVTKRGRVLTAADVEQLAAEAERGYPVRS